VEDKTDGATLPLLYAFIAHKRTILPLPERLPLTPLAWNWIYCHGSYNLISLS
jgi:hypothetical protein